MVLLLDPFESNSALMEPAVTTQARALPQITRAALDQADLAYDIVSEYYEAVSVVARDSRGQFEQDYFGHRAGVWLACMDNQIVACIALRALDADSGEIKRMYVRPKWRGLGLAQKLLEAAECFAVRQGYASIYLDTTDDMRAAARLYERNGYKRCERYNDNPQATIFMRKQL